jgi:hypothetical protein
VKRAILPQEARRRAIHPAVVAIRRKTGAAARQAPYGECMTNDGTKYGIHAGRVAAGLVVLALGALMLLDQHDVLSYQMMRFFPGIVLIILGAVRLLSGEAPRRGGRSGYGGFWLVFVGAWMIASESHVVGLSYHNSWPLLVIGVGVLIVMRELLGRNDDRHTPDSPAGVGQR